MKLFGNSGKGRWSNQTEKSPAVDNEPLSMEEFKLDFDFDDPEPPKKTPETDPSPNADQPDILIEEDFPSMPAEPDRDEKPDLPEERKPADASAPDAEKEQDSFASEPNEERSSMRSDSAFVSDFMQEYEEDRLSLDLDRELTMIIEDRKEDLTGDQPAALTGRRPKSEPKPLPRVEIEEAPVERAEPLPEDQDEENEDDEEAYAGFSGHAIGLIVLTVSLIVFGFVVYMIAGQLLG